MQILYDNEASLRKVTQAFERMGGDLGNASSPAEQETLVDNRIGEIVELLLEAFEPYEASDVIEAVRRHEMPWTLDDYRETEFDGLAVAIELAAMLVNGDKDREPGSGRPIGPDDVERWSALLHELIDCISTLRQLWQLRSEAHPLNGLAISLAQQALLVRSMQYEHIRRAHFNEIFGPESVAKALRTQLGFTWSEFAAVFDEAVSLASRQLSEGLSAALPEDADPLGFDAFMSKPGVFATFRLEAISEAVGLAPAVVSKALDFVSYVVASKAPAAAVGQLASGKSPVAGKSFAKLADGRYQLIHPAQAMDGLRSAVERELKKNEPQWRTYERGRSSFSERRAMDILTRLLTEPPLRTRLLYRIPEADQTIQDLGYGDGAPPAGKAAAEADGLFLIENVAVVAEVKAGGLTPPARAGWAVRLAKDLEATLGDAAKQARRLRDLVLGNKGLWTPSGEWIDLSDAQLVHSVVVSLEEFASAGIAMDELVGAGLVPRDDYPWVVSLHDLEVISEVFDRPAAFLLYLRRRTSPEVATLFKTMDEMDLVVLFLRGQLYAFPSPDLLRRQDPSGHEPSTREITRYRSQVPILVQSHTDALDTWMYYKRGLSTTIAEKPALAGNARVVELVDWLAEGKKPGWFSAAADLLDGDADAQAAIGAMLDEVVERSIRDGQSHSATRGINGQWGYTLFIAVTRGDGELLDEAVGRLNQYATVKKYQTRASRVLSLLLGPGDGGPEFEAVGFQYGDWEQVESMDDLIEQLPLQPLRTTVPPSARRARKRLRGGTGRKRR